MVIFHSYVSLPEGNNVNHPINPISGMEWGCPDAHASEALFRCSSQLWGKRQRHRCRRQPQCFIELWDVVGRIVDHSEDVTASWRSHLDSDSHPGSSSWSSSLSPLQNKVIRTKCQTTRNRFKTDRHPVMQVTFSAITITIHNPYHTPQNLRLRRS